MHAIHLTGWIFHNYWTPNVEPNLRGRSKILKICSILLKILINNIDTFFTIPAAMNMRMKKILNFFQHKQQHDVFFWCSTSIFFERLRSNYRLKIRASKVDLCFDQRKAAAQWFLKTFHPLKSQEKISIVAIFFKIFW